MPEDRRHSPGRRERDRLLDALWRELDALWRRLEKHEEKFDRRVDQLEEFHALERARTGDRLRERAQTLERWQKTSIAIGALGTLAGVAAFVVTVIR